MTSFVRFIFFIILVGILLNLGIVVLANVTSERHRDVERQKERDRFARLLERVDDRLCRADIGVEWQTLDAADHCLESSLLVRQYYRTETEDLKPMRIVRVKVPGSRILVDGLLLQFDTLFAKDNANLQVFRGKRLAYIDRIFVESQRPEDQFHLLPEYQVPELTRIDPLLGGVSAVAQNSLPSIYEVQMWQRLWDFIKHPDRRQQAGITITLFPQAAREVQRGHVYAAFAGSDGITLEEQTASGLLPTMREEADKLPK